MSSFFLVLAQVVAGELLDPSLSAWTTRVTQRRLSHCPGWQGGERSGSGKAGRRKEMRICPGGWARIKKRERERRCERVWWYVGGRTGPFNHLTMLRSLTHLHSLIHRTRSTIAGTCWARSSCVRHWLFWHRPVLGCRAIRYSRGRTSGRRCLPAPIALACDS